MLSIFLLLACGTIEARTVLAIRTVKPKSRHNLLHKIHKVKKEFVLHETKAGFFSYEGDLVGVGLTCDQFEVKGNVNASSIVAKMGTVHGKINSNQAYLEHLKVHGDAALIDSKIKKLEISGARIILKRCTVDELIIKPVYTEKRHFPRKQIVKLKDTQIGKLVCNIQTVQIEKEDDCVIGEIAELGPDKVR